MLRIVIVDDQRMFRENLKTVIELSMEDTEVVGLAANRAQALEIIHETSPNLVIMDVNMPAMNGVECVRALRSEGNEVMVLMLTMFDDEEFMIDSLELGAVGYLLKDTSPEHFARALKSLQSGCTLLSRQITQKLVLDAKKNKVQLPDPICEELFRLSQREFEILRHIGLGKDNQEISDALHLSQGTVRNYVSSIYEKLSLKDRSQAIRFAIQAGLVK